MPILRTLLLSITVVFALAGQSSGEFMQLFNGQNLDGWKQVGWGQFVVEDGMMKTQGGMGLLFFDNEKLSDGTLKVVFKTAEGRANSGVVIRMPEKPNDAWFGVHNGYEVQIDAGGDEWHRTGAIYSISRATKENQKPAGEWNTLEITLAGPKTTISLNGEVVNVYEEGQEVPPRKQWFEPVRGPRPENGFIGLQNHDEASIVYFKEVSFRKN
ncbi:MAG: DUF1080 domain-containing protein [Bryobacterales bacterium]|nr:DUF1080 domain-containing protein [Bryobacterales bacterium]